MMDIEIEHRRVELDDLGLHVALAGPEDGEPLLFLHGFPEFWMEWQPQMEHFAALGYRCIAPDQRGYADSDKPQSVAAYHIDRLADDVAGLLDALKLQSAHLVAHDWGGLVAWHMLDRHPQRVASLFVINAPHPAVWRAAMRRTPGQIFKSWYVLAFQIPWLPERLFSMNQGALAFHLSGLHRLLDDQSRQHYRQAWHKGMRSMIHWYRAALRYGAQATAYPERLYTQPVYILWGEEDRFLEADLAEESRKLCAQAELRYLEGVSHWVAQEAPAQLTAALTGFLAGHKVSAVSDNAA